MIKTQSNLNTSYLNQYSQAFAGQRKADPTSDSIYCLCESDMSNTIAVMCPAPPTSPVLRLEGMDANGIDVTWSIPQQYGDAQVSVSKLTFFCEKLFEFS